MSSKKSGAKLGRLQKYKGAISSLQKKFPKWKTFALGTVAIIAIIIVFTIIFWPSNAATTARNGDTVKVEYTVMLDDGTEIDSSVNESFGHPDPLQFTIGNSSVIPGFVKGVTGMSLNETKKIRVAPEDGYGPTEYIEDINDLPSDVAVGQQYFLTEKPYIEVIVLYVNESTVTLQNLNEMAGKYLNFEITLVELIKAK